MPFFDESRLRKVRVGIDSYTNTEFVLDVIGYTNVEGKSGIGSVPTDDSPELFVDGDGYFTGVVTATTFFAGPTEITGGAFADNLTVTTLKVNGLSTFRGNIDVQNDAKLGIGSTPTDDSPELFVDGDGYFTGVVTATTFFAGPTEITGGAAADNLQVEQISVQGLSTFIGTSNFQSDVTVSGNFSVGGLSTFTGISTFQDDVFIDGDLGITGDIIFDDLIIGRTQDNILGDVETGALQIEGGLGVSKNVSIGSSLFVNTQIGIGSTVPTAELDVVGQTELDDVNVAGIATINELSLNNLNVTGLSTFGDNVDINASVDISNDLVVNDALNVTGLSTFASDVDINASVDVLDDLTVNNNFRVVGLSTFQSNVRLLDDDRLLFGTDGDNLQIYYNGLDSYIDANGSQGLRIINNEIRFTDVGNNQLVRISGNSAGIVQLSYREPVGASSVKFETTGYGVTVFGGLNASGVSTFQNDVNIGFGGTTAFFDVSTGYVGIGSTQPTATLDVTGNVTISGTAGSNPGDTLTPLVINQTWNAGTDIVTGLSFNVTDTASGADSHLLDITIDGTSAFMIDKDISSASGTTIRTEGGVLTLARNTDGRVRHIFGNDSHIIKTSSGGTGIELNTPDRGILELGEKGSPRNQTFRIYRTEYQTADYERAYLSWISDTVFALGTEADGTETASQMELQTDGTTRVAITTTGNVGIGSTQPTATLDVNGTLNVTGLSTFGDNVDINASVDISQTLNVTGVATFGNNVEITGDLTVNGNQTILNTQILEVEDINIGIASADPKLSDAALDGAGITIHGAAGDKTLTWSNADSRMEFNTTLYAPKIETDELNLDNLNVTGFSTFGDNVDINASVDISNDLVVNDALNVIGLSTFGSNVDINGSVDISNDLVVNDDLSVTGLSTFSSTVDINANLDVDGRTQLDVTDISETLNVLGLSTFSSNVDINANLDVDGVTELDDTNIAENLSVTGLSTFSSNVEIDNDSRLGIGSTPTDDSPKLFVDGDAYFTGVVTATTFFAGPTEITGGAAADNLQVTQLNVSGLSTFGDTVDINADLDVDGDAVITGILTVGTTSPIVIDGDINSITVGTGASIHNPLDNVLTLGTNNEERVRLDQDGNLGIGTTNPSGAADVNNVTVLNAGIVTANFFYGSGAGLFDIFADAKGDDGAVQYNNATNIDGAADFFYDDTNFRVGIGSTVPAEKLDVIGNVAVAGTITATEFVGIGSQLTDITLGQLSDVDVSNLVALGAGTTTPDYLMIYDPVINSFRFVDPKTYFGINNDFNPAPSIVDYGTY